MTVYMPTILMNIIGHSTLYFKPFFFEAQVSVNLTVKNIIICMRLILNDYNVNFSFHNCNKITEAQPR